MYVHGEWVPPCSVMCLTNGPRCISGNQSSSENGRFICGSARYFKVQCYPKSSALCIQLSIFLISISRQSNSNFTKFVQRSHEIFILRKLELYSEKNLNWIVKFWSNSIFFNQYLEWFDFSKWYKFNSIFDIIFRF